MGWDGLSLFGGCCGDGGGLVWMVGAPLGRPVALTPGSSPGQASPLPPSGRGDVLLLERVLLRG